MFGFFLRGFFRCLKQFLDGLSKLFIAIEEVFNDIRLVDIALHAFKMFLSLLRAVDSRFETGFRVHSDRVIIIRTIRRAHYCYMISGKHTILMIVILGSFSLIEEDVSSCYVPLIQIFRGATGWAFRRNASRTQA